MLIRLPQRLGSVHQSGFLWSLNIERKLEAGRNECIQWWRACPRRVRWNSTENSITSGLMVLLDPFVISDRNGWHEQWGDKHSLSGLVRSRTRSSVGRRGREPRASLYLVGLRMTLRPVEQVGPNPEKVTSAFWLRLASQPLRMPHRKQPHVGPF